MLRNNSHLDPNEIRVLATSYACVHDDWHNIPPGCPHAHMHFHANCNRCLYNPDTCADCRKGKCDRCHESERVWGETPAMVREKMRAHWANDHEPADLLEILEGMNP